VDTFKGLDNLKEIHLSNNKLKTIDEKLFYGLSNLKVSNRYFYVKI